ncbi:hypothetical protein M427DRAFT_60674 [Gonapodya prolifera JEL478]|uniref:Uncharacterized protein n=1 Tax=Gonapodya prolifera (strain JEL478) TaxID=1344416 RepID=A0A139A4B9_GONPJ|nr:hypothetical protein M427DRAFT_60674 [Gonapodya prolifera JEL478]|eukprot:KXS11438.1 hypothetical protein M427DRAFT_60674 [Gonapodya prolifera JEL478]
MAAMDEIMGLVAPGAFKRDPVPDRSNHKPRDVIDDILENLEITVSAFRNEVRKTNTRMRHYTPTTVASSCTLRQRTPPVQPPSVIEEEHLIRCRLLMKQN